MKLPRDISGDDLARRLESLGYHMTRQIGSHMRLPTATPKEHHVTIPRHAPLKPKTFNGILIDAA